MGAKGVGWSAAAIPGKNSKAHNAIISIGDNRAMNSSRLDKTYITNYNLTI